MKNKLTKLSLLLVIAAFCAIAYAATEVRWDEADKYYGQTVTVTGKIVGSHNSGKACFLNFHQNYKLYFTAVIFAADFGKFPSNPESYYLYKDVKVSGLVREYQGKPEIILKSPDQIQIVVDKKWMPKSAVEVLSPSEPNQISSNVNPATKPHLVLDEPNDSNASQSKGRLMRNRFAHLASTSADVDSRLDDLQSEMDSKYSELADRLDDLESKANDLDSRIDDLDSKLDDLESKIDSKYNDLDSKLDDLESKINDLERSIRELSR